MPLLPLVQTRSLGALRIHALQAGLQHLDGGAMFGVVPKNLWERKIPADAKNRIPLGMRCLLIEHPDALVLVDTGVGDKESEAGGATVRLRDGTDKGLFALDALVAFCKEQAAIPVVEEHSVSSTPPKSTAA